MKDYSIYYVPTQTTALAHYFGSAIILPSIYYSNKPMDVQNIAGSSLLLSREKWVKGSNCSIEVIVKLEEFKLLTVDSNFSLLEGCLPISRIKRIYFLNEEQKVNTLWNINRSTAFVPEKLVEVEQNQQQFIDEPAIIEYETKVGFTDRFKRFDVLLGGFAFMKISASHPNTYPSKFFSTLSYFNLLIDDEVKKIAKKLNVSPNSPYLNLFSTKESEWSRWTPFIYNDLPLSDIDKIAENEGIKLEKKLGIVQFDKIDRNSVLFDILLLSLYGNNKAKSIEDLLYYIDNERLGEDKIEEITLLFGLRNGYSRLRNKYKFRGREVFAKFELKSSIDYYVIESIYQFVFQNKKDNRRFEYLDAIVPLIDSSLSIEIAKCLEDLLPVKKKEDTNHSSLEYSQGIVEKIISLFIEAEQPIEHPYRTFAIDKEKAIAEIKQKIGSKIFEVISNNIQLQNFESQIIKDQKQLIERLINENLELKKVNQTIQKGWETLNESKVKKITKNVTPRSTTGNVLQDLDKYSFSELKEVAQGYGIKITNKSKPTQKDISQLKDAIRFKLAQA